MGDRAPPRRTPRCRAPVAYLNPMAATSSALTSPCQERALLRWSCALSIVVLLFASDYAHASAQQWSHQESSASAQLNPIQQEIERERQRLASSDTEGRRDAVMRLGWMRRADSSRVAATALRDTESIVRATAARAVLSLPPDEAAAALLPLLQDRDEFVRRETAYALGETRSRAGISALITALSGDKEASVRGAAAVALGLIGDELSVVPLTESLARRIPKSGLLNRLRRSKQEENEFVRRAAARSLGQIGSRAGVPALTAALADERAGNDVRREAARSLGLIGDPAAVSALRAALASSDPYLSRLAYEALRKIAPTEPARPS
jgi:HEAT repeat protein